SDVVEKYRTCLSISDEAGSSSDGKSHNDHTTVTNNLIAGCRVGIYDLVDGGTAIPTHGLKYATIKNNTIIMDPYAYTTYEAGILLQDNGTQNVGSVISNNIMYGNGNGNGDYNANGVQTPLIFSQSAGTQPGITFSNNDYYSTWANPFVIGTTPKSWTQWKTAETETGSVLANPLFSDVSQFGTFTSGGFDYHGSLLQSASPAIALNAGWSQTGGTTPPPPAGDTTAPSVPTGLTATAVSTSQINLSWTASTDNVGVVGYLLFRGGVQIATASTTSYADTGLSAGTTYSYTVVALDAAGNRSPQSIAATATTQALADTTPPVLSNITATNLTSSSATITWTTNEPADDQVAYGVTTTYDTTTAVGTTLSTSHSVLLSNLSAGTTYHYQVRSKDAAGNSAASIDLTFATQALADTTPPAAITTLASSGYTPTSAVLSWVAPGDNGSTGTAASYDIRYSTAPITAANFSSATTVTGEPPPLAAGTSQSYTLVALASATTYYVAMTATDAAGNVSAISNVVSFSTPSTDVTPPTLSAIMATPSTTSSIISWTTNEPATSRVNYGKRKSSLTSSVSDSLLLTNHSLTLSPLTSGTTYYYRVVSKDAAGNTSTSSVRSFTTRAGAANALGALLGMLGSAKETVSHTGSDTAAAIGAFTGQAVDRQVFFSWKNPSENDFVRARLVRSDVATPSSATDGTIAYEGTGQSFVDTNLVNGRTYYYAIFPIRLTGADAAPSATLTIAPKAGVTQITLAQAAAPAVTATDTVSATSFRFTRNLKLGSSGADVRELQKFLNAMGFVIAASGPGSPGRESTYFGPSTMRALVKYQKSKGITPAAGFFGAGTRASIK
ncbi:MAG TPA: fibronectin type III domain-containing protein, partial [Candidatus Paceibacterota bacterium]|nr:fibronectin type III domain-containing protein [Candidatus Paceibacterota bacterium]